MYEFEKNLGTKLAVVWEYDDWLYLKSVNCLLIILWFLSDNILKMSSTDINSVENI